MSDVSQAAPVQPAPLDAPFVPGPDPFSPAPPAPILGPEPGATDEASLRAREIAVEQREEALNQRIARARELTTTALTDKDVEAQVVAEYSACAWDAFGAQPNITAEAERALRSTTICVMILRNGFPIVGTSVAAGPENYDHNDGLKWAKADAMAKLWLCEEYATRNRLMGLEVPPETVQ